ncbi:MAG: hypothetical protein AB1652_02600 [Bacillota bacterium]
MEANSAPSLDLLTLNRKEQQALSEILISSKSMDGIPRQRVMRVLRVRDEAEFEKFLRKVNGILGDALRVIYDERSNRCIALTRANASWAQELLDDRQLALLLFCFYLCMTSRSGRVTFDELLGYFQRSSLYAERKLMLALDHLVKSGFLRMEELTGEEEEKKRVYWLTEAGRHVFPLTYLMRVVSESQGGEVSLEQVRGFFTLERREEDAVAEGGVEQLQLFTE